ncbi:unnamed protein product [Macrosiphum euphorbiae]|uniref:Uncharacterized protein n=1 Tax=Macrosiphum euphorbiae TaxID=13131 RepID=A0AAV0WGT8_9HEMI|nr:unnamed protein product [Macrosiphum euphorbiae]
MSWKGLKVIGIINVIFLILEMIVYTIYFLGFLLHIEAVTKYEPETDLLKMVIIWILAMLVDLLLLYFNFGLINQNTRNFVRDWLISHGIALVLSLLGNLVITRSAYELHIMTTLLLIEIILVVIFCYIIPSSSGSNTGNSAAV